MSGTLAAILGNAAGAVTLVGIVILVVWFCRRSMPATSETGSSEGSVQVGRHTGIVMSLLEARHFDMEELSMATKHFSDRSLIGVGKFSEVYKGLLNNGMLVAIKKRPGAPSQEFVQEVRYLSAIQHQNIVSLLGYCQDNNLQLLLYESLYV